MSANLPEGLKPNPADPVKRLHMLLCEVQEFVGRHRLEMMTSSALLIGLQHIDNAETWIGQAAGIKDTRGNPI